MQAPVLLILFNRPDTTSVVFQAIRKARPDKLYIFADAPRTGNNTDVILCNEVKNIVSVVDWECNVHKFYSDKNLGCGPGPAAAITWAFENEDRLIILEDDCVPANSFFPFCNELLEKYKDDERIWTVSGNNYYEEIIIPYSYIFSNYGHSWGWATWKRCWNYFDIEMKQLSHFFEIGGFENVFSNKKEIKYFDNYYRRIMDNSKYNKHVWDSQANFAVKSNRGLSIVPAKNLVKNIGYQGTHSKTEGKFHNRATDENYSISTHPIFALPYIHYDKYSFKKHYLEPQNLIKRIGRKVNKLFLLIFKKTF